jgi:ankyrin repeat protein
VSNIRYDATRRPFPDSGSPRDLQTQLHALLPSGYGKSHTKFHPSNDAKVKVRLDCLRRCKAGRISKERAARRQKCIVQTNLDQSRTISTALWESCDGGSQAFRNYATKTSLPLPRDLSDAQPVTSSLLLLDGSEVSSHPSVSSFYPSIDASTNGLSEARRPTPQISNNNNNRAIQEASSSTSIAHAELSTSSHDIGIIEEMLGAKHSGTCVKHVYRALRLSSGSSLRSNLTSLSSLASSLLSKLSSRNSRATTAELTKEEMKIWNELVDDSKMDIPRPLYTTISPLNRKCCMPPLLGMSFDTVSGMCETCGFSVQHRRAMSLLDISGIHLSPVTDFYGNTLLHCAAAACKWNESWKVREMVAKGANANIRNTSGETFLHILCRYPLKSYNDAIDFVSILQLVKNVPLRSISDYHGCTILHHLFRSLDESEFSIWLLSEIFKVIQPAHWKQHFNIQDNAGNKLFDVLQDSCSRIGKKSFTKSMATILKDITPPPSIIHYQSDLGGRVTIPGQMTNEDFYGWLGDLTLVPGMTEKEATERMPENIHRRLFWIDDLGDTPLTALLKSPLAVTIPADSFLKYVKCMLKFGAEIHIRDRNGDTALAIAARLGIHSVVTLLLEEGANVHSRDYLGVGILSQTERSMHLAAGDEKLWAMIWSCRITLIDAGAKEEPTDQDEWMLPLSTRLKLQEGQDVNGQLV